MRKVNLPFILEEDALHTRVAGVDEAGRGPLAGDVVAAAVILDHAHPFEGLTDSKKLTPAERERLFPLIQEKALAFAIGRASVEEIDTLNILQASLLAMTRAVAQLGVAPELIYVDGNKCPPFNCQAKALVKGDSRIASIAAASVLAKVTRDREMEQLDQEFPGYGLAQHKGYPTQDHMAALRELGPSRLHRKSFGPVAELLKYPGQTVNK